MNIRREKRMKKFEKPTMDVEMFEIADIITTSNGGDCRTYDCDDDLGLV